MEVFRFKLLQILRIILFLYTNSALELRLSYQLIWSPYGIVFALVRGWTIPQDEKLLHSTSRKDDSRVGWLQKME